LADFNFFLAVGLSSKFATGLVSYFQHFQPHLKCVITSPCEIQKVNNSNSLDLFNSET